MLGTTEHRYTNKQTKKGEKRNECIHHSRTPRPHTVNPHPSQHSAADVYSND